MNNKLLLIVLSIIVIIGLIIVIYAPITHTFISQGNNSSKMITNSSTHIPNDNDIDFNKTLTIPPNDYVINSINWSNYPNLKQGYVYTVYIAGPTDTISHKFIEVQILTEINDTSDNTIIRSQLSGIAYEVRNMYGPNSDIHILGTKDGAATWDITLYPYQNNPH